jgi:hypothetical protein
MLSVSLCFSTLESEKIRAPQGSKQKCSKKQHSQVVLLNEFDLKLNVKLILHLDGSSGDRHGSNAELGLLQIY